MEYKSVIDRLKEENGRLQENIDKKDNMLSMLTEGLKEVCFLVDLIKGLQLIIFKLHNLGGGQSIHAYVKQRGIGRAAANYSEGIL